jgi:hypothetical protein
MTNDDDNEEARIRKARTAASALSFRDLDFVCHASIVLRHSLSLLPNSPFGLRHFLQD